MYPYMSSPVAGTVFYLSTSPSIPYFGLVYFILPTVAQPWDGSLPPDATHSLPYGDVFRTTVRDADFQ